MEYMDSIRLSTKGFFEQNEDNDADGLPDLDLIISATGDSKLYKDPSELL